uniref:Reverse transcriptase domain-containing protein n=1 Tax=Tanacetum cinerariifolium TaxID=118510 RepID=A0A6L2MEX6_TANCI|nr:reverse transcriptase domain-containing protein [Tanacetum cinerariifolium]
MSNQTNDLRNMLPSYFQKNTASTSGSRSLPSNIIANPRGDLNVITTQSGVSYDGPPIPPHFSSLAKLVERVPEPKPTILYPLRVTKQKLRKKDDNLALKFVETFRKLHFDLSFADALLHMPKFALMFKSLLNNKEKLFDLATTPVNENCSAVILKKLPKKLGDLDKFLIPCDFPNPWVSPVHCVPKKGGMIMIKNEDKDLIPTTLVTGWRVCIDYQKLNDATRKDHFPLPFMDQMHERLSGNVFYCFLDGFSEYFQIPIDPQDQENTTFTYPYGTFAYRLLSFGLCNAPGTFQRCMMAIFHDMIEETMEVFMDDFSVFKESFTSCLSYLDEMLKWCKDTNLVLNWEKCHVMVKEGIVLCHKISKARIKVDRAKVDVIAKILIRLPSKTIVYTDDSALKYLLAKEDTNPRLLWWILLLQESDVIILVKKGAENLAAKHLSRLENPHQDELEKKEITETFPL